MLNAEQERPTYAELSRIDLIEPLSRINRTAVEFHTGGSYEVRPDVAGNQDRQRSLRYR
ncbi:MAG: hypothetical protein IH838_07355 [Proteobacteria bacterium]|nr:hypothetical protein [Pseudomonadota bacterium]